MAKENKQIVGDDTQMEGQQERPELGIYPSEGGVFLDIGALWVSIKDFCCPCCNERRKEFMVSTEDTTTTIVVVNPDSIDSKVYIENSK